MRSKYVEGLESRLIDAKIEILTKDEEIDNYVLTAKKMDRWITLLTHDLTKNAELLVKRNKRIRELKKQLDEWEIVGKLSGKLFRFESVKNAGDRVKAEYIDKKYPKCREYDIAIRRRAK